MNLKKAAPYLGLIFLAILALGLRKCQESRTPVPKPSATQTQKTTPPKTTATVETRGLNRHPAKLNYSRHARCRMACRQISEKEIEDILQNGTINYRKSALQGGDCQKKYAVEGVTADQQRVRIIFAPCANEITVVTCIDLGKEWVCNCR